MPALLERVFFGLDEGEEVNVLKDLVSLVERHWETDQEISEEVQPSHAEDARTQLCLLYTSDAADE